MTVVFSTYQSIDVISEAQKKGLGDFDLIIYDEAPSTTGVAWPTRMSPTEDFCGST